MKDRMKVYHGIPKSVTDENTIFYASFDGSIKPEIGLLLDALGNTKNRGFSSSVTGNGIAPLTRATTSLFRWNCSSTPSLNSNEEEAFTFDIWCHIPSLTSTQRIVSVFGVELILFQTDLQVGHWKDRVFVMKPPIGFNHFRVIVYPNETGLTPFKVFHNGKFKGEYKVTIPYPLSTSINSGHDTEGTLISGISDLHISNIDRGDFFPNLPQDFIEGKAIVKEKFGQQQIKGDPLVSQVTELKVPHNVNGDMYDLSDRDSDNLAKCVLSPELRTSGASTWVDNTSKIRIKGLNGEVISGVIDTDTALCKVVTKLSATTIKVDSISKIATSDVIRFINPQDFSGGGEWQITNIDSANNVLTLNTGVGADVTNWYIVETTISSSSPVVKSQDGQTVVGNWSGLGTNEATFTLGTNTPSLSGKDLYVTYSLNMSPNNSHFPEIPYSVDKAFTETGVEMNPVTEIVIEDDFRGKIGGSSKECPHTYKVSTATSLRTPSEFVTEQGDDSYQRVQLVDTLTSSTTANTSGAIPQQLFSFNLIEIVERKLGCAIPSSNKVQWLRENVTKMWLNHYGYGVTPTGNLLALYIGACNLDNNTFLEWQGANPHTNHTHTSSTTKLLRSETVDGYVNNKIQKDGFVYFVAHTTASNGNMPSIINTDYVKLEVKLKLPSNFQALYCDNKRAREDKCNPVLVQKETKTVQRLLPSKESFVTESKVVNHSNRIKVSSSEGYNVNIIHNTNCMYITSFGTGDYSDKAYIPNIYNEYPSYEFTGLPVATLKYPISGSDYAPKLISVPSTGCNGLTWDALPVNMDMLTTNPYIVIKPYIINDNGEIMLYYYSEKWNTSNGQNVFLKVPIPNRPLIK